MGKTISQRKNGSTVTADFGETSVGINSHIAGERASVRVDYRDVPFDIVTVADRWPMPWLAGPGLLFGLILLGGNALAYLRGTGLEGAPASNMVLALILIAVCAARIAYVLRKRMVLHVFQGPQGHVSFLDDQHWPAMRSEMEARRNEVLRRELFERELDEDDETRARRLGWLVDRGVITREEYDRARREDADRPPVGFAPQG